MSQLVRDARGYVKAKKYQLASESLMLATVYQPYSAQIAGEAGWVSFLSGDLKSAKSQTISALSLAKRSQLKAMLYYNLGRIAERDGKPDEARTQFKKSLALRKNRAVRKRLEALGAKQKPTR